METIDSVEMAYIEARNSVNDEELLKRIRTAPDCGGALLVELSDFLQQQIKE